MLGKCYGVRFSVRVRCCGVSVRVRVMLGY